MKQKNPHKEHLFSNSTRLFLRRVWRLFNQPIFLALTIFGNFVIVSGATLLFYLERGTNPQIDTLLDTFWWAISTVTTVGYGDVTPVTPFGRIIGIGMMLVGTALFWSYTALFADAVISKEIIDLEDELKSIQKTLSKIDKNEIAEKAEMQILISNLKKQLEDLHRSPKI